jgi:hypothetical protein
LDAVAERLQALGIVVHTEVLAAGDVASAIVARAERDPGTSMIAMATHGRSGLGRWLLGSVAEKVLQAVPRPLLLVRARASMPAMPIDVSYRRILVPLDGSRFVDVGPLRRCVRLLLDRRGTVIQETQSAIHWI